MFSPSRLRTFFESSFYARRSALSLLTSFPLLLIGRDTALTEDFTMRTFRTEVLDILRRHYPDKTFSEGSDDAAINYDDQNFYLSNLFASVRPMPRNEREDSVVKYFTQAFELNTTKAHSDKITATWEGARALLRPRLVSIDYLKTQASLVHRDFSRDVMITYSLDLGKFEEFVSDAHATKWGVTVDTIQPTAIGNLEALSNDIPIKVTPATAGRPGAFAAVSKRDGYGAARLLLPVFRSRIIAALGDFVYAGIPNRDFLVVWSKDFSAHAGFVAQIKKDVQTRPYPLTDEIFVVTSAGVRPASHAEIMRAI